MTKQIKKNRIAITFEIQAECIVCVYMCVCVYVRCVKVYIFKIICEILIFLLFLHEKT